MSGEKEKEMMEWLKVGQSFGEENKGEEGSKRRNVKNYMGENLEEQKKKFFNVEKRKGAADFIDEDLGEAEEADGEGKRGKSLQKVCLVCI